MKKLTLSIICILILLAPFIFAAGSLQTGTISPNTANLCGDYQQYLTITASNILNKEAVALTGVSARLFFSGNPGLSFVSPQEVNLGDIAPSSTSGTNPGWTIQCNSPMQGIYTAYVNYTTANGYKGSSIDEAAVVISVHESSPFIGNLSVIPGTGQQNEQSYQIVSDNTPTLRVMTTRNSICKGTLDADEAYQDLDFMFYGTQKDHDFTFIAPITEGQHSVYVRCKDEFDNIMPSSLVLYLFIDTAAPQIFLISPLSKVVGDFTQIKISVNEESECRYGKNDNSFSELQKFDNVNGSVFTTEITELEEDTYSYYIKCKDTTGNIAAKKITFDSVMPPSAQILFEKESPLSKGTYELRLEPSKDLRETPTLFYTFTDDAAFKRDIGLIKTDDYYKGYIIIEDSDKTRSGVFTYKGYDLDGNEGTLVTRGKIFLVDTVKPNIPDSLQGSLVDDYVELKWYYDGEKPNRFNIYRSTVQAVSYINFYDESLGYEFSDRNILSGQLYYYRAAAVDDAGNVGLLSNEISVYTTSGQVQPVETKSLPTKETRDWKEKTEKDIESVTIDLDWAENNLKDLATKEKAVDDLGLIKQAMAAKDEISKLKNQIKAIDVLSVSDSELRDALSKADALIARTKKTTPQSLKIEKATNIVQATTQEDISNAVKEFLRTGNLTESQAKKYQDMMEKTNKIIKVEAEIKTVNLELLDETTESKVMVEKKISYESPETLKDVIVMEIIPKTVAGDMSSIDIRTPEAYVIKEDPIFAWTFPTLSFEKKSISYVILSGDTSESVKNAKTIVLLDPIAVLNMNPNGITGFSVFLSGIASNGFQILGLVLGIIIILGLGMYYMITINEVDMSKYLKGVSYTGLFKNSSFQKTKTEDSASPAKISEITEKTISKNELASTDEPTETVKKEELTEIKKEELSVQKTEKSKEEHRDLSFAYVLKADDPLKNSSTNYFFAKNGEIIRGVSELKDALEKMDDFTFFYHVTDSKNDFADWIENIYKNDQLADYIRNHSSRDEIIKSLDELMK